MVKAYFNSENFSLRRIRHANYSRNAWQHIVMCLPTKTFFFFNKEHVLLYYWTCQLLFVRSKFACGCPTIHSIVIVHDCGVLQSLKQEPLVLYRTDYRLVSFAAARAAVTQRSPSPSGCFKPTYIPFPLFAIFLLGPISILLLYTLHQSQHSLASFRGKNP